MAAYEPKSFVCSRCGLVLGEVYRVENSRVTQLRVYRYPRAKGTGLDQRDVPTAYKFAAVQVSDATIPCFCGHETGWYANQTAIAELIERKTEREHGRKEIVRATD